MKLKKRSEFWLTRFLNYFGGMHYWTTIGDTVYYPDAIDDPLFFTEVIEHEKIHIEQYKKYSVPLFLFLYCVVPLPTFLSYFRWKFEREAYLTEIKSGYLTVEEAVMSLDRCYGKPWPKSLMRDWFYKNA